MVKDAIEEAAHLLLEARRNARQLPGLPPSCRPTTLEEGYAIQDRLIELLAVPTVGWFLGGTNAQAREILGLPTPYWARLLEGVLHASPAQLRGRDFLTKGLDVEFAFRMAADLRPRASEYRPSEVADAVATLHPAIDIVNAHFVDWMHTDWPSLVADNGTDGAIVYARAVPEWRSQDLRGRDVRLVVNGTVVESGVGANAYGDPLHALTWFVNDMSRRGRAVRAAELVVTGSCTRIYHVETGDEAVADFGELGQVRASFLG